MIREKKKIDASFSTRSDHAFKCGSLFYFEQAIIFEHININWNVSPLWDKKYTYIGRMKYDGFFVIFAFDYNLILEGGERLCAIATGILEIIPERDILTYSFFLARSSFSICHQGHG